MHANVQLVRLQLLTVTSISHTAAAVAAARACKQSRPPKSTKIEISRERNKSFFIDSVFVFYIKQRIF